ncbi:hypothetical protein WJX79_006758 [Trebouxia sp. C0005]
MFAPGPVDGFFAGTDSSPGDSTNWDFLQGLEFDSGPDTLSLPVSRPHPTSNERLKEKNRKAQQRARQKKKERAQTVETQLAETARQLHDLKLRQGQLEARNQLLELAASNRRSGLPASPAQHESQTEARDVSLRILASTGLVLKEQNSVLVLTVHDQEEQVKVKDIRAMSPTHIAKLYTAYVRKQAQCLLDIEADSANDSPALTQLCRWTMEITAILICFGFGDAKNLEVLYSLNMADGTLSHEALPDDANDSLLATLQLTDAQQQDMLHLRRCLYIRLDLKHTADKLAETKEWADALCTNRANESRAFVYAKICLSRGILTSIQSALTMVHQYPRGADSKAMLEVLAKQFEEPSIQRLSEPCEVQHAADWQGIVQYVDSLDASSLHGHTPLLKGSAQLDIPDA